MHERLQQNHTRLQVQLAAKTPVPAAHVSAGPVKAFLDTTFRTYAARIQSEFSSLRAACARAVQREQHQAAEMRVECARLARERDVAEEKVRVLLERRARAAKRSRAQVEEEEAENEARALLYPPSPVSPPQLPTQSPPPRLLSPFVLAAHHSPRHTPDPEDTTGFDLTVSCDKLPRPAKRRRVGGSSGVALVAANTHSAADTPTTTVRETCPAALDTGECDMDLESESESDPEPRRPSPGPRSPSFSRAASRSPSPSQSCTAQPKPEPAILALDHVDVMYMPADGKLICRVCLLAATSTAPSAAGGPIHAFVPGASWDMLRAHCEEAHPAACRDVARLGPAGVRELRRRLGLGMGVGVQAASRSKVR